MKTRIPPLLITFALVCFALVQNTQAISPAPDGCYPNFTTAEGCGALHSLTSGDGNTGLGWFSLFSATTGSFNTGVGAGALALDTGDSNTATGAVALFLNTTGSRNTATGTAALLNNTDGAGHTAVGYNALATATAGASAFAANTAVGVNALFGDTTGNGNTAVGAAALFGNTTGGGNTAIGNFAGSTLTTGNNNIAVGAGAGIGITTGDFNIDIGSAGTSLDSGTIRIGDSNTQFAVIAGISGATIMGAPVVVTNGGQLGVSSSSARFKDQIKPMDKASEALFALKPVTFHYKNKIDPAGISQFGLVAEDVEKVNPDLVVRDKEGKPYTVRYDAVNAMLLNEFLKEHQHVQEQDATIARQQKQIEALTAGLEKVSAQLEVSKTAPQIVCLPAIALREGGNDQ
jgi:hypothetical protein